MNLDQLIAEGEGVRTSCFEVGAYGVGGFLTGLPYEEWISKSIYYLEDNCDNATLLNRFRTAATNAAGNDTKHYDTMMGVLKALKAFE
ncbi:hypothetical protein [Paenibacillus sp. P46E]|uniref:hypothetical protein n=1 Tax=Paenibacillus sp. P46E TaxID=1349436 RepID=UPI00093E18C4|nr:hypothetical protein [Paenibacillus sp. P46E]OKP95399.1 hypothetical protein A3849_26305 [Paenibacillus sp. P46E]